MKHTIKSITAILESEGISVSNNSSATARVNRGGSKNKLVVSGGNGYPLKKVAATLKKHKIKFALKSWSEVLEKEGYGNEKTYLEILEAKKYTDPEINYLHFWQKPMYKKVKALLGKDDDDSIKKLKKINNLIKQDEDLNKPTTWTDDQWIGLDKIFGEELAKESRQQEYIRNLNAIKALEEKNKKLLSKYPEFKKLGR